MFPPYLSEDQGGRARAQFARNSRAFVQGLTASFSHAQTLLGWKEKCFCYFLFMKIWHWDTWTKTVKHDIKVTSFWGLFFSEIGMFVSDERWNDAHPGGTWLKNVEKYQISIYLCFVLNSRTWLLTKNVGVWLKLSMKISDFGEYVITRGSI